MRFFISGVLLSGLLLTSCGSGKTAEIWTDRPEVAIYGEYFNTVQSQYKVTIKYHAFPAEELKRSPNAPDIIVASWLKNSLTGTYFKSLNSYLGGKKLSRNDFYPRLLEAGKTDRKQYLLPVSFNIPSLIFLKDIDNGLSNSFTMDFDEIKTLSGKYNVVTRGAYTRMGFSPLWNDNFLFAAAVLSGASFREAAPLAWDSAALDNSMGLVYDWIHEVNTNIQTEEDFIFKYFFEPPEKLVQGKRVLFSYMESRDLFALSSDAKNNIDFRWIMEQNKIPISEDMVFLGIPKKAKSRRAAKAFTLWFFRPKNQRVLLEYCKVNRINENVFGICDGFSALSSVTGQVFPHFYPELLGRAPPSEYFTPPNVLPGNWAEVKERVVLPYLHDRVRNERAEDTYPLERRLTDWIRVNR